LSGNDVSKQKLGYLNSTHDNLNEPTEGMILQESFDNLICLEDTCTSTGSDGNRLLAMDPSHNESDILEVNDSNIIQKPVSMDSCAIKQVILHRVEKLATNEVGKLGYNEVKSAEVSISSPSHRIQVEFNSEVLMNNMMGPKGNINEHRVHIFQELTCDVMVPEPLDELNRSRVSPVFGRKETLQGPLLSKICVLPVKWQPKNDASAVNTQLLKCCAEQPSDTSTNRLAVLGKVKYEEDISSFLLVSPEPSTSRKRRSAPRRKARQSTPTRTSLPDEFLLSPILAPVETSLVASQTRLKDRLTNHSYSLSPLANRPNQYNGTSSAINDVLNREPKFDHNKTSSSEVIKISKAQEAQGNDVSKPVLDTFRTAKNKTNIDRGDKMNGTCCEENYGIELPDNVKLLSSFDLPHSVTAQPNISREVRMWSSTPVRATSTVKLSDSRNESKIQTILSRDLADASVDITLRSSKFSPVSVGCSFKSPISAMKPACLPHYNMTKVQQTYLPTTPKSAVSSKSIISTREPLFSPKIKTTNPDLLSSLSLCTHTSTNYCRSTAPSIIVTGTEETFLKIAPDSDVVGKSYLPVKPSPLGPLTSGSGMKRKFVYPSALQIAESCPERVFKFAHRHISSAATPLQMPALFPAARLTGSACLARVGNKQSTSSVMSDLNYLQTSRSLQNVSSVVSTSECRQVSLDQSNIVTVAGSHIKNDEKYCNTAGPMKPTLNILCSSSNKDKNSLLKIPQVSNITHNLPMVTDGTSSNKPTTVIAMAVVGQLSSSSESAAFPDRSTYSVTVQTSKKPVNKTSVYMCQSFVTEDVNSPVYESHLGVNVNIIQTAMGSCVNRVLPPRGSLSSKNRLITSSSLATDDSKNCLPITHHACMEKIEPDLQAKHFLLAGGPVKDVQTSIVSATNNVPFGFKSASGRSIVISSEAKAKVSRFVQDIIRESTELGSFNVDNLNYNVNNYSNLPCPHQSNDLQNNPSSSVVIKRELSVQDVFKQDVFKNHDASIAVACSEALSKCSNIMNSTDKLGQQTCTGELCMSEPNCANNQYLTVNTCINGVVDRDKIAKTIDILTEEKDKMCRVNNTSSLNNSPINSKNKSSSKENLNLSVAPGANFKITGDVKTCNQNLNKIESISKDYSKLPKGFRPFKTPRPFCPIKLKPQSIAEHIDCCTDQCQDDNEGVKASNDLTITQMDEVSESLRVLLDHGEVFFTQQELLNNDEKRENGHLLNSQHVQPSLKNGDSYSTDFVCNASAHVFAEEMPCRVSELTTMTANKVYVCSHSFAEQSSPKMSHRSETGSNALVGFSTAKGSKIVISDLAINKVKNLVDNPLLMLDKQLKQQTSGNMHINALDKFVGFYTGRGSKIEISDLAMNKAKSLFDDPSIVNDIHLLSTAAFIKEDEQVSSQLFQGNETKNISSHDGSISKADHLIDKTIINRDTNKLACPLKEGDLNISMQFVGFSTARGSSIATSDAAMSKAMHLINGPPVKIDPKFPIELQFNDNNRSADHFILFSTANGSKISVSDETLNKVKRVFADFSLNGIIPTSPLVNGGKPLVNGGIDKSKGQILNNSSEQLHKPGQDCEPPKFSKERKYYLLPVEQNCYMLSQMDEELCHALDQQETRDATSKHTVVNDDIQQDLEERMSLDLHEVMSSDFDELENQAKMSSDCREFNKPTNSSISKSIPEQSRINKVDQFPNKYGGFCTGKGSKISISNAAVDGAKQLVEQPFNNIEKQFNPECSHSINLNNGFDNFVGFRTAKGSTVSISDAALKKVIHLFDDSVLTNERRIESDSYLVERAECTNDSSIDNLSNTVVKHFNGSKNKECPSEAQVMPLPCCPLPCTSSETTIEQVQIPRHSIDSINEQRQRIDESRSYSQCSNSSKSRPMPLDIFSQVDDVLCEALDKQENIDATHQRLDNRDETWDCKLKDLRGEIKPSNADIIGMMPSCHANKKHSSDMKAACEKGESYVDSVYQEGLYSDSLPNKTIDHYMLDKTDSKILNEVSGAGEEKEKGKYSLDNECNMSNDLCQPISGYSLPTSGGKLSEKRFLGFCTAKGTAVKISEEALMRARQKLSNNSMDEGLELLVDRSEDTKRTRKENKKNNCGFRTASVSAVEVSEIGQSLDDSVTPVSNIISESFSEAAQTDVCEKTLNEGSAIMSRFPGNFHTERGDDVHVSDFGQGRVHEAQRGDLLCQDSSSCGELAGNSYVEGARIVTNLGFKSCFVTAKGASVNVNEASLRHVRQPQGNDLLQKDSFINKFPVSVPVQDEIYKTTSYLNCDNSADTSLVIVKNDTGRQTNIVNTELKSFGFLTGKGCTVSVCEKSLRAVRGKDYDMTDLGSVNESSHDHSNGRNAGVQNRLPVQTGQHGINSEVLTRSDDKERFLNDQNEKNTTQPGSTDERCTAIGIDTSDNLFSVAAFRTTLPDCRTTMSDRTQSRTNQLHPITTSPARE